MALKFRKEKEGNPLLSLEMKVSDTELEAGNFFWDRTVNS